MLAKILFVSALFAAVEGGAAESNLHCNFFRHSTGEARSDKREQLNESSLHINRRTNVATFIEQWDSDVKGYNYTFVSPITCRNTRKGDSSLPKNVAAHLADIAQPGNGYSVCYTPPESISEASIFPKNQDLLSQATSGFLIKGYSFSVIFNVEAKGKENIILYDKPIFINIDTITSNGAIHNYGQSTNLFNSNEGWAQETFCRIPFSTGTFKFEVR